MDLEVIGGDDVYCIHLAQEWEQWCVLVIMVVNI